MNLKLLKAFITIADTESFSKAAERLFISQPALSQNIKQLESHFGVNLIKRDPHNFFLTEAGKVLYEYAVNLLEASDLMEEAMDSFRSSLGDKLRVGATSVIGGYAVPCSIFMFKKKHPDAIITLKLGNHRQILDHLREDLIDVAIVEGDKPEDSFVSAEIHTEEMVMVAPYTEQWKASGHLRLDDLAKVPLIMREKESATRCTVEGTLRKSGISLQNLNVVMELDSVDSIKAAVEAGYGVSILPKLAVKKELYNKALCLLQIESLSFLQPIHIVYKRKARHIIASEFIKLMKSSSNGFC